MEEKSAGDDDVMSLRSGSPPASRPSSPGVMQIDPPEFM